MGKKKYIKTPELLMEYFLAYKEQVKSKPIKKHVFVGKDGNSDYELREKPLTMEGFETWLFENNIIGDVSDYFENKDKRYNGYVPICRAIKIWIRKDQIEGGMAGIYNPSITQRLNNLTESIKSDSEVKLTGFNIGYGENTDQV